MKLLRRLLWLVAGTAFLLLVLSGTAVWLLNSSSFAQWLAGTVQARSAGSIRLEGVTGTLAGELTFRRVEVDVDESRVVGENVRLSVDLHSILARALVLDFLYVDSLTYTLAPASVDAGSGASTVPILVRIDDIQIAATHLVTPDREWSVTDTRLALRLLDNHLELTGARSTFDEFVFEGDAALTWADLLALDVSVCATGRYSEEDVAVCAEVNGDFPDLTVDVIARAPFPATATGRVHLADDFAVDVEVQWTDAALRVQPNWSSPSGHARLTGPVLELRAVGDGTAIVAQEAFEFAVDARYGATQIEIYDARVSIGDMVARATGEVDANFQRASLVVSGTGIDPGHWRSDWPGNLDVDGTLEVDMRDGLTASLQELNVAGELRGRPIAVGGALSYADATLRTDGLNVVSRSDTVFLAGSVGDALDVRINADINDMEILLPGAHGRVRADVAVLGTLQSPRANGELELRDAGFGDVAVAMLDITGAAGLAPSEAFSMTARATGLSAGVVRIDTATVTTQGTIDAHEMSFAAAAADWRLDGDVEGGWSGDAWRGTLDSLSVDPRVLDRWELAAPGSIVVSRERVELPNACLAHGDSQLCIAMSRAGSLDDFARLTATRFDIGILTPFFPDGFGAAGAVDFDLRVDNSPAGPRGEASVRGSAAEFSVELGDGAVLDFPLETVQLGASIDQARLRLAASIGSEGIGRTVVNLDVADVRLADSPLSGNVSLTWADTTALALLSPDVESISGPISADITLGGTLDAPTVGGEARWTNGMVEVPAWGLVVESIDGRAMASGGKNVTFTASGLIDGAAVNIEGSTLLDPTQSWPTRLRLRGEELPVVRLPDAEVYVSPDLTAEVMLPDIRVTGTVLVPRANIEILGLPAQAVMPSADTIVHGREQPELAHPLNVRAQLDVVLGDDVRYAGGNVNAKVTGTLSLDYESERRASAVGALTLTGQYDAYGNPLDLERGQLIFAGPWDNPALDVRAVRRIEQITVGVQLVGTLKAPESNIFSDPAMSEADALSYLLFGRPLEDSVGGETATLQSAALAMGLLQALPAIERIGTSLGFDEFSIRGTNTDAGALMAGKYLGPDLYLRYSYGLFNRIGGLLLRYRINDRLSLETQSGEQKSMDLLYTVEKD